MTKALCAAIAEPMNQIHDVQLQAGIQPSHNPSEKLRLLSRQCGKEGNHEHYFRR